MSVVVDHLVFRVSDVHASRAFYEPSLAELGFDLIGASETFAGFGKDDEDDFYIKAVEPSPGHDRVTSGAHVAFIAPGVEAVRRWHAAAVRHGGTDIGEPGIRPQYSGNYYAAFVLDPDGNNVEAVFHSPDPIDD